MTRSAMTAAAIAVAAVGGLVPCATTRAVAQDGPAAASPPGLSVGGAIAIKPKYEGAKDYDVYGFPLIFPSFGGGLGNRISVRGADDVRVRLLDFNGFEAGALGGYAFGRDDNDADILRGIGDVDGGLVLGGFAGYRFGMLLLDVSYHHTVTGDDGAQVSFGGEVKTPVAPGFELTTRVGATYADDAYMSTHFGITATQAANSWVGLPVYDADAGIKDVHASMSARIDLTDRWVLRTGIKYTHLVGDAADSPVVEREDQLSGSLGLSYRFDMDLFR